MALLHAIVRLTYDLTFLRHVTSNKMKKNEFLQIVKVKGQTQGQIKVKGQGHMNIFTILYVIDVI